MFRRNGFVVLKVILLAAGAHAAAFPDWVPKAPPLPSPPGRVVSVSDVNGLIKAVDAVKPGDTVLLKDGTYFLPRYIEIRTDSVTLRSASGIREAVVLDGSRSMHGELLGFRACTGVTVADLTIQNVRWNGFKINSDTNVQNLTLHNCVIHNIWQRGVKSVRIPPETRDAIRPRNMRIEYCLFYNDRPKRFEDDPTDTPETFNGNYIGGIDTMSPQNWLIRDNVFMNIQGRTREGRGCVFLWHHAEDCVVERNVILDCDVGIALGNSSGIGEGQSSVHAVNTVVRNNFITRTPETGILADYTRDCAILHNTVLDPGNRMKRLLRLVHDNAGLRVLNNLCSGPGISVETRDDIRLENNLVGDRSSCLRDPDNGDLHLAQSCTDIVDQGIAAAVGDDVDGLPRDSRPDIGADEWAPPASGIVPLEN